LRNADFGWKDRNSKSAIALPHPAQQTSLFLLSSLSRQIAEPVKVVVMQAPAYPGINGFLGTRASLMLDLLFLAMFAVVLVLGWSISQVKYRHRYELHKWVQVVLGIVLLAAVILFEIDIRIHGWEDRAAGAIGGHASSQVRIALYIHLCFAVTSVLLWPTVIIRALRRFPNPPAPAPHSPSHKFWGWLAAVDMLLTAITGWTFYYLAFVR
jgi:putative membrane protein